MVLILGSRIIKCCLIFVLGLGGCSIHPVDSISIESEQEYWNENIYPENGVLAPFVLSHTFSGVKLIDKRIKTLNRKYNLLAMTIGIDNGVYEYAYYAWDEKDDVEYIFWNGFDQIKSGSVLGGDFNSLVGLMDVEANPLVYVGDNSLFGGYSFYVVFNDSESVRRFAFYDSCESVVFDEKSLSEELSRFLIESQAQ